jgi:hypothetical protein
VQNLIVRNTAGEGTALYLDGNAAPFVLVANTIADNVSVSGVGGNGLGGTIYQGFAQVNYYNNLIIAPPASTALRYESLFAQPTPTIIDNDVFPYEGTPIDGACAIAPGTNGNLSADPQLTRNDHLRPSSPAIDAGDNAAPLLPATDLSGNPRIVNRIVDLGAFEHS